MIWSHFLRSQAKLELVVPSIAVRARSLSMTMAQHGELLQPFCGAEISTSTPMAFMSTHMAPEAMQSSTNSPPLSCTASATARIYVSGRMMPDAVSTCGANTTAGFFSRMATCTSAIGAGAQGACEPLPVRRAFITVDDAGIWPMSKIWVQR